MKFKTFVSKDRTEFVGFDDAIYYTDIVTSKLPIMILKEDTTMEELEKTFGKRIVLFKGFDLVTYEMTEIKT